MSVDKSGLFIFAWRALAPDSAQDTIEWTPEFQFHETRKWRFDWALPERKIAVEVSGGQWAVHGGRHSRDSDRDKRNHAAADGWVLFEFSTQQLGDDPSACIALVLMGLGMEETSTPKTRKIKARIGKQLVSEGFVYEGDVNDERG